MRSASHANLLMLLFRPQNPSYLDVCKVSSAQSSDKSIFGFSLGMNSLSGSTWKGAKLRIGEAKPEYHER